MDKINTADLSSGLFTILINTTQTKSTKFVVVLLISSQTGKQWHNKESTELYCLFLAADSIVDSISFIRHIVLWSEHGWAMAQALYGGSCFLYCCLCFVKLWWVIQSVVLCCVVDRMYQDKLSQLKRQVQQLKDGTLPIYMKKMKKLEQQYKERLRLCSLWVKRELEVVQEEYKSEKELANKEFEVRSSMHQ